MLRLTILQGPGPKEMKRVSSLLSPTGSQMNAELRGFVVQVDDGPATPATLTMREVQPALPVYLLTFDYRRHRFVEAEYDPIAGRSNEVIGTTLEEDIRDNMWGG